MIAQVIFQNWVGLFPIQPMLSSGMILLQPNKEITCA
jgi:hypothetical protein